jgi:SSS family solute:Na+ symporter
MDIYKRFHQTASERTLVAVGRFATLLLVGLGLLWIPFMELISGQLFTYLQSVQAYISPPIAAVFLFGILWKRASAQGAIAALSVGFVLGIGRLVLELNKSALDGVLLVVASINFLHFALVLFAASVVTLVVVSLLSPAPPPGKTDWMAAADAAIPGDRGLRRSDMVYSSAVLLTIGAVWLWFT